ncbi:copper homeostasis protein CutC [Sphingomonas sp.]|uniref:copper homeostasis protein CutC n=1 Tax=Sphingomonas sp. TaxID=28214 RepID=UPI0025E3F71E|nr:copper homeostasis protein CutC [Sphingomonas sp.]
MLEICVQDAAGIAAAVEGGADRIELCSALELGGLTPSAALVARAVATGIAVHAMVRPRAGSFVHDADEVALIADEIVRMRALGAAGVVVGALREGGRLDTDALARFRDAARDMAIVLHRAIDVTPDPLAAVEQACGLGYDKILTSGGELRAADGAATIARMVQAAQGRLSVIAGAGVNAGNVAALIRRTGVREVHSSASAPGPEPNARSLAMGFAVRGRRVTSASVIRRLRDAIEEDVE